MRLYLLKYNNYYNRICKRELSIDGYLDYLIESNNPQTYRNPFECNFNPNDGVSTYQVINWDGPVPDYVVCSKNGVDIDSRWFVLEGVRTRGAQFQLTLYRDTIVDYYPEIMKSVTYIEKGIINDITNPLLYNAENMSFNQLKKKTTPLYDKSGCPWIVGFTNGGDISQVEYNIAATEQQFPDMIVAQNGISNFPLMSISGTTERYALDYTNNSKVWFEFIQTTDGSFFGNRIWDYIFVDYSRSSNNPSTLNQSYRTSLVPLNGASYDVAIDIYANNDWYYNPDLGSYEPFTQFMNNLLTFRGADVPYTFKNILINRFNIDINNSYSQYLDKDVIYVQDANNSKIYKFTKITTPISEYVNETLLSNRGDIYVDQFISTLRSALSQPLVIKSEDGSSQTINTQVFPGSEGSGRVAIRGEGQLVRYTYEEVVLGKYTVDISAVPKLDDQPYSMFCMPYSDNFDQRITSTIYKNEVNREVSLGLATAIQKQMGKDQLYDIQIVPYCPIQNAIFKGTLRPYIDKESVTNVTEILYKPVDAEASVVGYLYWCQKSKLDFEIEFNIKKLTDPIDAKVSSMTDFYRLVSPAQGTEYKFESQKIGDIQKMYVQCNYRPFNSNIRVVPKYQPGSLYYSSNLINSQEGLNIMEDMSLSQITDQWVQYELNNKNYRQTFQRQIDHMEHEKTVQIWQDSINTVNDSIASSFNGFKSGGVAGAIVGGVHGTIQGGTNLTTNIIRANEAIDYTKDNFEFMLGNIKALPVELNKVSSLGINNSWVPLVEEWSCTDMEKTIAKNKIIYNGMTISTIDNPQNYISGTNCYLKGKLIRIENIDDEFHVVNTIAGELNKGIYFN